jgi:hypothetical protein
MQGIYFATISNSKSGFTNQIFSLVNSILVAIKRGNKIIVLDSFQRDFNSSSKIDACKIFDLDKTNYYLKKYDIALYCKSNFNYKLNAIFYGVGDNILDLTDNSHSIITPRSYNTIKGDPCVGVPKELFINYTINDKEFSDIYSEDYNNNIWVKDTPQYEYIFRWINSQPLFDNLIKTIHYQPTIDNHSFIHRLDSNSKLNVIHIRLEEDAIIHWSKQNNMNQNDFKLLLSKKYIEAIKDNFNPSYKTMVVGSKENSVIDYLHENGYEPIFYNLNLDGREINALYDLIQASQCNETFISNFNYSENTGSTFSYYITLLSNPKKIVSIDLDNINKI